MKWQELWEQSYLQSMSQKKTAEEAVENTFAIILLTEWDAFKKLNFKEMFSSMERPAYIFDGRNILDEQHLKEIGFLYYRIGKAFKHAGWCL